MLYIDEYILDKPVGNNALSYDARIGRHLVIPRKRNGCLQDLQIGENIVFEEVENGTIRSCRGLKEFVSIPAYDGFPPIIVFDNHNHALYFWIEALQKGILSEGFELIHIDEHSDLWPNTAELDRQKALQDNVYAWEFTNFECNVGNYIQPALKSGLVGTMIRIENDYEFDKYEKYVPKKNSVLNLDLDIFAPEMGFINEAKKIRVIQNLMKQVSYVTIATSPFFIDQGMALTKLHQIFLKRSES